MGTTETLTEKLTATETRTRATLTATHLFVSYKHTGRLGRERNLDDTCCILPCIDDEAEAERRKVDCLDDMQFLEQQFSDLKEL